MDINPHTGGLSEDYSETAPYSVENSKICKICYLISLLEIQVSKTFLK